MDGWMDGWMDGCAMLCRCVTPSDHGPLVWGVMYQYCVVIARTPLLHPSRTLLVHKHGTTLLKTLGIHAAIHHSIFSSCVERAAQRRH